MNNQLKKVVLSVLVFALTIGGILVAPQFADAQSAYSSGSYGTCTYNSCGITLGADASVAANVTPAAGTTTCSVGKGEIQVTTQSSTGYTLTMTDSDTDTSLKNGTTGTISATSGTAASPTALTANKWGYRVDGINGFGAGPTSIVSNGAIPTLNFATIPASSAAPDIIATTTVAADPYTSTFVYFGVCANPTLPNGAYSDAVTYSVVVN